LQGEAKTNFAGTIGSAMGELVEPGFITVGLTDDASSCRSTLTTRAVSRYRGRFTLQPSAISEQVLEAVEHQ
jgi:hypothetical protein